MVKSKNDPDKTARSMGLSVLVLAILLIGLFTFLYFRSKNSKSSSEQTNNTNVSQTQSSSLDAGWSSTQKVGLAKNLTAKGAIFYGAYWCSHCKDQKAAFSDAMQYVTYYECDPQGDNPKVKECNAAGITGYPTWIFNGNKKEGAVSLDELATWIGYSK